MRFILSIAAIASSVFLSMQPMLEADAAEGEVVAQREYFAVKDPWLVWDQSTCSFKPTDEHPQTYSAQLRKVGPGGLSIVYATADTTLQVQKTINGSFQKYAKLAGIDMTMLSNEFPSKTKPILIAKQVAAMNPKVVISNVWIPDLYTQIGKTYLEACLPFLNMHAFPIKFQVPGYESGHVASGLALADGVIQLVKERGWAASDTWMLICGMPLIANGPGTDLDVLTSFMEKVEKELQIPKEQNSGILDCKENPDQSRVVATDWLTAHPQAKKVIAMFWNDFVAVAMAQALEQKGYTSENAIAAGGQANDAPLQVMTQPNAIFQVNFDKNFPTWGIIGLSMAEDVAAGRPVPSYVDPGVVPVIGAEAARKLIEARKASAQ
jgi:ABC-type sugar transport system substrate-binding protein